MPGKPDGDGSPSKPTAAEAAASFTQGHAAAYLTNLATLIGHFELVEAEDELQIPPAAGGPPIPAAAGVALPPAAAAASPPDGSSDDSGDDAEESSAEDGSAESADEPGPVPFALPTGKRLRPAAGSLFDAAHPPAVNPPPSTLNLAAGKSRVQTTYSFAVNPNKKKRKSHHTNPNTPVTDTIRHDIADDPTMADSEFYAIKEETDAPADKPVDRFDLAQGPHTVAHVALEAIMESAEPDHGAPLQDQINILEGMFLTTVELPDVVQATVAEEIKAAYNSAGEQDQKNYFNEEYKKRMNHYMKAYTEAHNDLERAFNQLRDPVFVASPEAPQLCKHVRKRLDEMMNLHPSATYAWQRGGKKATKKEIGGKGERKKDIQAALKQLGEAKSGDERQAALEQVAEALVPLLDGTKGFANKLAFKTFIMERRLQLIDADTADELYAMIEALTSIEPKGDGSEHEDEDGDDENDGDDPTD